MTRSYYNVHLQPADERNPQIFFLRDMSITEYRNLCRKCINSLFETLYKNNPKEILVLDQFFTDGNYNDFERNYAYCPNLKTINVWRDPRDIFEEAKWFGAEWLPTQNADSFVQRFLISVSGRTISDTDDYISIRFEDLVLNYDATIKKIEMYLGLKPEQHIAPKSAFDPSISNHSVRLWKQYTKYNKEYNIIAQDLSQYLYTD